MKIPLKILGGRVILNSTLTTRRYHTGAVKTQFLVDTGSPDTFLSEGFAFINGIPIKSMDFTDHKKVAGSTFNAFKMQDVTLYVRDENDKVETIKLPVIQVLQATKRDQDGINESMSMPCVIGMDFLLANKLALYVNPYKDETYLESAVKEGPMETKQE